MGWMGGLVGPGMDRLWVDGLGGMVACRAGGKAETGKRRGKRIGSTRGGNSLVQSGALIDLILGRRFFSTLPSLLMIAFFLFIDGGLLGCFWRFFFLSFYLSIHPPTWVRRIVLLVFTLDGVGENGKKEIVLRHFATTYSLIADVSQQHYRIEKSSRNKSFCNSHWSRSSSVANAHPIDCTSHWLQHSAPPLQNHWQHHSSPIVANKLLPDLSITLSVLST